MKVFRLWTDVKCQEDMLVIVLAEEARQECEARGKDEPGSGVEGGSVGL